MGKNVTDIIKFHSPLLLTIVVDVKNSKDSKGFALDHGLRGFSPTQWGRHGGSLASSCGGWLHPTRWQLGSKGVMI